MFFKRHINELRYKKIRQMSPNTVRLAEGGEIKFSVGLVYCDDSGEVIGKYTQDAGCADKFIVECGAEYAGTVVVDGNSCRVSSCHKTKYIAKNNTIKDINGTVIAWYKGDIVGASAAFLCLK